MLFTISGYGGADDGHEIRLNGVQIFYWNQFVSYTFGPIVNNINIGDILDVYNVDNDTGTCWCAGEYHYIVTYNGHTWNIDYHTSPSEAYCYCSGTPSCVITPPWNPSEYPAHLTSYLLTADGPVSILADRFNCASLLSSSSSVSSSSSLSSSSSGEPYFSGITYYSNFRDINAINNPIIDNNVKMQYDGFWETSWDNVGLNFDKFGYGIKKTQNSQGSIYCDDASKLFSMQQGYVGMTISLPHPITNGVYLPLKNDSAEFDEYVLWGVNVGRHETSQPCLYASLTPSGIEFTIWTSYGKHTICDITTDIAANTNVFLEFVWNADQLNDYLARMIIRVNEVDIAVSNLPIGDNDSIDGLNFYAFNTPFLYNNFECTIRKLLIYNKVPDDLFIEWWSSSSSSTSLSTSSSLSSISSISSRSSSSSSSYVENWSSSSRSSISSSSSSSSSSSMGYSNSSSSSSSSSSSYIKNWSSSSSSSSSALKCNCTSYTPDTYGANFPTWSISGANIFNTDDCALYARVQTSISILPPGLTVGCTLYKDFVGGTIVASGSVFSAGLAPHSGTVTINEVGSSGLSGVMTFSNLVDADTNYDMYLTCLADRSSSSSG